MKTNVARTLAATAAGILTAAGLSWGMITPAAAQDKVAVTAGDGGLVEQTCNASASQVRVDSSSVPGMSACFSLTAPTGWVAVNITGSYGVVNNLAVPVSVAFKLPDGAVYWQDTVAPGQVRSVDVDRRGSTVVELQVTPVASPSGPGTATLTPGENAPNIVSLRSAGVTAAGKTLRVAWSGVQLAGLDRNSGFNDRLDASFEVVEGLGQEGCVSLRSAAYPDVYLHTTGSGAVAASVDPDPMDATWCVTSATAPLTGVRLASAVDQTRVLTVGTGETATTTTQRNVESVWFVDPALAWPGV